MMRRNPLLAAALAAAYALPGLAGENRSNNGDTLAREERVQILDQPMPDAPPPFAIGGLIEVEAAYSEPHDGGRSESDLTLATLELTALARLSPWAIATLVLLYEQNDTEPMEVDQAFITLGNPDQHPLWLTAGRMYVPFGKFESGQVSDPLTLELAETRESAVRVGLTQGGLTGSLYLFNGEVEDGGGEESLEQWGAEIGWVREEDEGGLDLGAGFISSIAESDTLQEAVPLLADQLPGLALHAIWKMGPWRLIAEHVGALDRFNPDELPFRDGGAKPQAWNLEAGYTFELLGREASIALGHQRTSEALALGLPETATLATLSVGVVEKVAVSLEYALLEDYAESDGGSGESGHAVTVQLAAEF